ncbi:hypothetical protein N7447_002421 [Penicillium robsamsonii]|uniref:uncharacterized protein n=1 Tax=Penicillium robsamsonii TaxID=1792511 RepID=UPI0025492F64|nr:uncharacterized protein N7447_002421 [Penicillium robsamsonii]KAJ5836395.1 hypothetical protein N7447_002421 [Penicillium robsamsonii]
MDLIEVVPELGLTSVLPMLLGLVFAVLLSKWIFRLYFHSLRHVPGPKIAACTSLWLAYHTFIGDECTTIFNLHRKYGPTVRVAPNDVDIASGEAIKPIYVANGGFPKAPAYSKYDIDGHPSIFSTLTRSERGARAKAVSPLFSTVSMRQSEQELSKVFEEFVDQLRLEAKTGRPVNVLHVTRCLAVDALNMYLFQRPYGALGGKSPLPSTEAFEAIDRFLTLAPGKIASLITMAFEWFMANELTEKSMDLTDSIVCQIVNTSSPKTGSYQSRLLEKQSVKQTQVEVKDLFFAGADAAGMNMATILWYLAKYPEIYSRLCDEIQSCVHKGEDAMSCDYLRGTVREGLRLSLANPCRFQRSVPQGGWSFHQYHFPAGTSVGVSAFHLHQDEDVFPIPSRFMPERWFQPTEAMLNHFFPFGKGTRACLGQSLGNLEVTMATLYVAQSGLLEGATVAEDKIEIKEWFNCRPKGGEINIHLSSKQEKVC